MLSLWKFVEKVLLRNLIKSIEKQFINDGCADKMLEVLESTINVRLDALEKAADRKSDILGEAVKALKDTLDVFFANRRKEIAENLEVEKIA